MARRSLRPQLNQIRAWVRQGRTDAWIAHQLEVTVREIEAFKADNDLAPENGEGPREEASEEVDLRAEDDAQIAAELDAAEAEDESESETAPGETGPDETDEDGEPRRRGRGRRGGRSRGRRGGGGALEGTFDHGEEGYGLWLDPAVKDDPIYAEHWAGHRPVEVTVEEDRIVIRRAGDSDSD